MAGWGYELLEQKFDFSRMGPQDKYDLADACGAYVEDDRPANLVGSPPYHAFIDDRRRCYRDGEPDPGSGWVRRPPTAREPICAHVVCGGPLAPPLPPGRKRVEPRALDLPVGHA